MAQKLKFDLVSPERLLLSEEVDMVVLPGHEGDLGVMADHAPLITTLRAGWLIVNPKSGYDGERIFVRGGFAEVTPAGLTVLAEQALRPGEIDGPLLDAEIRNAEEDVKDAKSDETRLRAQYKLDQLREVRSAL
ncbi:MAG: F0F1 ATP synthase subunit epsilon [Parvibaculaceae bacterium]|nr:F0F1 ATP synthase subunit epsilon [Parvibaculaceae bacterium]